MKNINYKIYSFYEQNIRPAVAYDYTKIISDRVSPSKFEKICFMIWACIKNGKRIIQYCTQKGALVIPATELVVTLKCTLNCYKCSAFMWKYKEAQSYDVPDVETNKIIISNLLEAVDRINSFSLIGGEPLTYSYIEEILDFLGKSSKIAQIQITTNGTVAPIEESVYESLKRNRVIIHISNYGDNSRKKKDLIEQLKKHGIVYRELLFEDKWIDAGEYNKRNRPNKELIHQYRNCDAKCGNILNGKMHICSRSSHCMNLSLIPDCKDDYVDLLNQEDLLSRRNQIKRLFDERKFISACDYCDFGVDDARIIEPGKQIK